MNKTIDKRITHLINNKVNYISGTISPSATSREHIESLGKGLSQMYEIYEKHPECNFVSVQVKHMGSRLQYYYFPNDMASSYCVTRNGYKCKLLDDESIAIYIKLTKIYETLKSIDFVEPDAKLIIFDGELMPWKKLGDSIINHNYTNVASSIESEEKMLIESGFYDKHNDLIKQFDDSGFADEKNCSSKKLCEKYGESMYQTYKAIKENRLRYESREEREKYLNLFNRQLDLYAKDGPTDYEPFSVLKIVYDYKEVIPYILDPVLNPKSLCVVGLYSIISEHAGLILDISVPFKENYEILEMFWKRVCDEGHEGIILKPNYIFFDVPQYIKVRNPDYLSIIYGFDYTNPQRYEALKAKKHINKKLQLSINETIAGYDLLKVPYSQLTTDDGYAKLLERFLILQDTEKLIDVAL